MPKIVKNIGDLAVCKTVALTLMLYPVISPINRSPALLTMDLTLTQRILGAKLDWRINLDRNWEKSFLFWIGVPFLMITPILRICMPKNAHTWMILHIMCAQILKKKKKKKIDLPTLPIFRPKGQTNIFFFFRPYIIEWGPTMAASHL